MHRRELIDALVEVDDVDFRDVAAQAHLLDRPHGKIAGLHRHAGFGAKLDLDGAPRSGTHIGRQVEDERFAAAGAGMGVGERPRHHVGRRREAGRERIAPFDRREGRPARAARERKRQECGGREGEDRRRRVHGSAVPSPEDVRRTQGQETTFEICQYSSSIGAWRPKIVTSTRTRPLSLRTSSTVPS